MFLRLIFKKLGLKENKYVLAFVYGCLYFVLVFSVFQVADLILKKGTFTRDLLISFFIGVVMAIIYLIKWEVFKSKSL